VPGTSEKEPGTSTAGAPTKLLPPPPPPPPGEFDGPSQLAAPPPKKPPRVALT
jgi:hypothetical protein